MSIILPPKFSFFYSAKNVIISVIFSEPWKIWYNETISLKFLTQIFSTFNLDSFGNKFEKAEYTHRLHYSLHVNGSPIKEN